MRRLVTPVTPLGGKKKGKSKAGAKPKPGTKPGAKPQKSPQALARQRREERRLGAGGAGIDVEPRVLTACAVEIAADREALGVPPLSPEETAALDGEIDDQVMKVGVVIEGALPSAPTVATGSGVTAAAISGLIEQRTEMMRTDRTATKLAADVSNNRRVVGVALRRLGQKLVKHTREVIADPRTPQAERDRLESDAGEMLAAADKLTKQQTGNTKGTNKLQKEHKTKVAGAHQRSQMRHTLADVKHGVEVGQGTLDQAADLYAEVDPQGDPGALDPNRRGSAR